jgi:hypothetical protein
MSDVGAESGVKRRGRQGARAGPMGDRVSQDASNRKSYGRDPRVDRHDAAQDYRGDCPQRSFVGHTSTTPARAQQRSPSLIFIRIIQTFLGI